MAAGEAVRPRSPWTGPILLRPPDPHSALPPVSEICLAESNPPPGAGHLQRSMTDRRPVGTSIGQPASHAIADRTVHSPSLSLSHPDSSNRSQQEQLLYTRIKHLQITAVHHPIDLQRPHRSRRMRPARSRGRWDSCTGTRTHTGTMRQQGMVMEAGIQVHAERPIDRSRAGAAGAMGALPTLPAASLPPPPAAGGWTDMDAWTPGRRLHACATSHRLRPTPTATRRRRCGRWRRRCVEEWPGQGRLVFDAAFGTGRRRDLGVHACTHEHDRMTLAGWGLRVTRARSREAFGWSCL